MGWFASFGVGVLTGALGVLLAGAIAAACVNWYRISGFEGKSGYFVVFTALGGGFASFLIGIVTSRIVASGANPGFLKALGASAAVVAGIAGAAALIAWLLADIPPKIDGDELDLEIEFRLPVGRAISAEEAKGESYLTLGSVNPATHVQRAHWRGTLDVAGAKQVDGRWIVTGKVDLETTRGLRSVDAVIAGESVAGFIVPLRARPGVKDEEWSEWGPRPRAPNPPWPDTKCSYRFRVQRRQPPPEPPDPAALEAARFAALKPGDPLDDWLQFLDEYAPPERSGAVLDVVEARAADLAAQIGSADHEAADRALWAVTKIATVPPNVVEAVTAAGKALAADVRAFNELKEGEGEYYTLAIELDGRFTAWRHAWWTVQQKCGVDGLPLLREFLELARACPEKQRLGGIEVNARVQLEALEPGAPK
jgi:hypothetical protein